MFQQPYTACFPLQRAASVGSDRPRLSLLPLLLENKGRDALEYSIQVSDPQFRNAIGKQEWFSMGLSGQAGPGARCLCLCLWGEAVEAGLVQP